MVNLSLAGRLLIPIPVCDRGRSEYKRDMEYLEMKACSLLMMRKGYGLEEKRLNLNLVSLYTYINPWQNY